MSGYMIDERNTSRIKNDAFIAVDALQAIVNCCVMDGRIHSDYLKEKTDVAKRCLEFMDNFIKENDE